jgi:hypothetical protein
MPGTAPSYPASLGDDEMAAKITSDLSVGISAEIAAALEMATEFSGVKSSTYARIALVEKLCREGFLIHPGTTRLEKAKEAIKRQPFIAEAAV